MHSRKNVLPAQPDQAFVFLPGWGFDGRILEQAQLPEDWIYPSAQLNPTTLVDDLFKFLDQENIKRIVLVGWSLGANLAYDFAKRYPERVSTLYLLSLRSSWPSEEIEQLRQDMAHGLRPFMQAFYRKCFAGHKKAYRRFQEQLEAQYLAQMDKDILDQGLNYLQSSKPVGPLPSGIDLHIMHGGRDIIAPASQMVHIDGAQVTVVKQAGHPIFLDPSFSVAGRQRKDTIRQKFSRAAATYDQHADIQKQLATELITGMPENFAPATILEMGCGTGNYTSQLGWEFPGAEITALDFSEEMLARARAKMPDNQRVKFRCLDAEDFLRQDKGKFEMITANATIQWFEQVEAAFKGVSQRLAPGGMFICSVFGPRTLYELGLGMAEIFGDDFRLPSSSFSEMEELRQMLAKYFKGIAVEEWTSTRRYDSLAELLGHIKKTGTAGWQLVTPVFSRSRLARLEKWFGQEFGGCRTTYQVFIVRCGG